MPENGIRSCYSQSPFQIMMLDDHGIISTGSAFYYEGELGDLFLITNWHNLSGRHFVTNKLLDNKHLRYPTHIQAKLWSRCIKGSLLPGNSFTTEARRIDIYKDDEALWLEHPALGSLCDVIALPVRREEDCPANFHVASNKIGKERIPVIPGATVFIIGFPRSISVGAGLPIWKSGYISSEPFYDVVIGGDLSEIGGMSGGHKLPAFFIDSLTREGMSGSPVFASYTGSWNIKDPYSEPDWASPGFFESEDYWLGSNGKEFVGCYSGRIGSNEEGAALGLCWRKDIIEQICTNGKPAQNPHA
jgi:hypothetical protein